MNELSDHNAEITMFVSIFPPEPPTGSWANTPSDTTEPQSTHTSWAWQYKSSSTMFEEPQPRQLKPARDILQKIFLLRGVIKMFWKWWNLFYFHELTVQYDWFCACSSVTKP